MVNICVVPGCINCSDRPNHLSYYRLPFKNSCLLKQWIHKISRAHLHVAMNDSMHMCFEHFVNARGRMLLPDEVPTWKLSLLSTRSSFSPPRRSFIRYVVHVPEGNSRKLPVSCKDAGMDIALTAADLELLEKQLSMTHLIYNRKTHFAAFINNQHHFINLANVHECYKF